MLMNIAKLENYLRIDSSRYNRPSIEALILMQHVLC